MILKPKAWLAATLLPMTVCGELNAAGAAKYDIFDNVHFDGEIRPRFEYNKEAEEVSTGSTRITLGIRSTKTFSQDWLHFFVESNSVGSTLDENDDFIPYQQRYLGGMDYSDSRISQLYPEIRFTNSTIMRIGRQKVNVSDGRLVGSDDWRQMFRTFDGVSLASATDQFSLLLSYFYAVNPTYSDLERRKANDVFVGASYKVAEPFKFGVHVYEIGALSTTYELEVTGTGRISDNSLVSYRLRGGYQGTPWMSVRDLTKQQNVNSGYLDAEMGLTYAGFYFGGGIEGLSPNIDYDVKEGVTDVPAFQTPYASSHDFNGMDDVFIQTPQGGLIDGMAKLGYKSEEFGRIEVAYHKFNSFGGELNGSGEVSYDLGSEVDAKLRLEFYGVRGLSLTAAGGWYKAGDIPGHHSDVKAWLQADYKLRLVW